MRFHASAALRRGLLAAGLALAAGLPWAAQAQALAPVVKQPQIETPKRVLFVGNSYFYYGDSLHNHVRRLVMGAEPALERVLEYKSATIGGAALAHHPIEHLTTPGRIGVREAFEVVVLQGGSAEPLNETRRAALRDKIKEFNQVIAARGGKTALYMTHAYVKPHKEARAENLRLTEEFYVSVGNEVGALVIPVGLAFEEAYRRKPELALHKDYDGSHPELIGTYLAACTVYASLYGKSPLGNPYDYFGKIDRPTATFLQQVAHDTVRKFHSR